MGQGFGRQNGSLPSRQRIFIGRGNAAWAGKVAIGVQDRVHVDADFGDHVPVIVGYVKELIEATVPAMLNA